MTTTTHRPAHDVAGATPADPRAVPGADLDADLDMERYARATTRVRVDDLDLPRFRERPLAPEVLRSVRALSDLETHSIVFLRDLLVTPSHADAAVSAFLTMWNYEEYGHGQALDAVLAEHGLDVSDARLARRRAGQGWWGRMAPVRRSLLANAVGEDFVAVHLTWCLVAERVSQEAYLSLAARCGDEVLAELLHRIAAQEERQGRWCEAQARTRLAGSARTRRVVRAALRTSFSAPGAKALPAAETRHLARHLFGGADGPATARRIDAELGTLPGLAGLHVTERALVRSLG
ncbi:ferritin-like domain-containing protein [Kineococcus sp. NUM-3379]